MEPRGRTPGSPASPPASHRTSAATTRPPRSPSPTLPRAPTPPPAGSSTTPRPVTSCSQLAPRCVIAAPNSRSGSTWPPATADLHRSEPTTGSARRSLDELITDAAWHATHHELVGVLDHLVEVVVIH